MFGKGHAGSDSSPSTSFSITASHLTSQSLQSNVRSSSLIFRNFRLFVVVNA